MGVFIKGMKMPKECRECYLLEYYEYLDETQCSVTRRMLAERGKPISFDGRPGWCPLVEVQEPHGRLIDEAVVLEMIRKSMGIRDLSFLYHAEKSVVNEIFHAPTVIEAEGKG